MATQVSIETLDSWLSNQPANTIDTPYEIEVTNLASDMDVYNLGNYIKNSNKYVDLRPTTLPTISDDEVLENLFNNAQYLVYAPDIPSGVAKLFQTFSYCISLKTVPNMPNTVTELEGTFEGCTSLVTPPIIPNSVTIMNYTFSGCTNLETAPVLPSSLTKMFRIFEGCTSLMSAPLIPASVTVIGEAFKDCTSLTNASISIPTGITDINGIFRNCNSLVNAPHSIPASITEMSHAFQGCSSLVNAPAILGEARTLKSESSFSGCTSLVNAPVVPTNDSSGSKSKYMFFNCTSLAYKPLFGVNGEEPNSNNNCFYNVTQTRLGGSTSQLESYVHRETSEFEIWEIDGATPTGRAVYSVMITNLSTWLSEKDENTTSTPFEVKILSLTTSNYNYIKTALTANNTKYVDLRYTDLPSGITTLQGTFEDCVSLIAAPVLPDTMTTALVYTFRGCTNLIFPPVIPNGITSLIGTFMNCTSLTHSPVLPNSLEFLNLTFLGDSNLQQTPTIPNTVTQMNSAFRDCTSLTSITNISSSVVYLQSTFQGCTSLTTIPTIPNSTRSMNRTFYGCIALTSAPAIPEGVTDMSFCFYNCTSLVTAPALPTSLSGSDVMTCTFQGCTSLISTPSIPSGVTSLGYTFSGCTSLTTVSPLHNAITGLTSTFVGCTSLVTPPEIPDSVTILSATFYNCTSLTSVPNVPASVTTGARMFKNCTSLRKIDKFEIPLATLRDNTSFQDMFQNCPSLESIGYVTKESDWHIWRLKYDVDNNNDVLEGEVYFKNGDYAEINRGTPLQITKSDLNLLVKTDELWFPKGQAEDDSAVKLLITKLLANKYGVFINDVLPLDEKTMVLWADDPSNVKSNFLGGGGSVFDIVYPVGCVYTQYPEQKSPAELGWSRFSTWEELDYGGAFFRAEGGNAGTFNNEKAVTAVSGAVLTIPSSGAVVGSLIYDPVGNETRTVTAVSGNSVTVNSAFTSPILTNVLIGQSYQNAYHSHGLSGTFTTGGAINTGNTSAKTMSGTFKCNVGTTTATGCFSQSSTNRCGNNCDNSANGLFSMNLSHRHQVTLSGSTGYDGSSTDKEARPVNMTVRVWKRTA